MERVRGGFGFDLRAAGGRGSAAVLLALWAGSATDARAAPVAFDLFDYDLNLSGAAFGPLPQSQLQTQQAVSWNVSERVGGFLAGTGAEVRASSFGQAALISGFRLGGMLTDLSYAGAATVSFEEAGGTWTAQAQFLAGPGAQFVTSGPEFEAFGDFRIRGGMEVAAKGCFAGVCEEGKASFDFDTTENFVRAGNLGGAPFQFAGQDFDVRFGEPYQAIVGVCPDIPECTVGFEIGRFTVFNPDLSVQGALADGFRLAGATIDRLAQLNIDLDFFLASLLLLPQGGAALEIGPVTASLDLFDVDGLLSFDMVQKQTFDPRPTSVYSFGDEVLAEAIVRTASFNGSRTILGLSCSFARAASPDAFPISRQSVSFGSTAAPVGGIEGTAVQPCYDFTQGVQLLVTDLIEVAAGDRIRFKASADFPANVTVDVGVRPQFVSAIELDLVGSVQLDLLKGAFEFEDIEDSFGPVFSHEFPGFTKPFELFRRTVGFGDLLCSSEFRVDADISRLGGACAQPTPPPPEEVFLASLSALPPVPPQTLVGVPEPSSLAVLLAGLLGLAAGLRRRTAA